MLEFCEGGVIVVVAVDEPQFDAVDLAGGVDGAEESWPVGVVREVPEVADLNDDRAPGVGCDVGQMFDPFRVAVSVTGDEDAPNVDSVGNGSVREISVIRQTASRVANFRVPRSHDAGARRLGMHRCDRGCLHEQGIRSASLQLRLADDAPQWRDQSIQEVVVGNPDRSLAGVPAVLERHLR